MKNAIFITCYNCEAQLPRVWAAIQKHATTLKSNGWTNIYLIDNQSKDETFRSAKNGQKELQLLGFNVYTVSNKRNYGLGGTHKVAFMITNSNNYRYCCILHGDDQADPSDLASLKSSFTNYDAMLGSRFSKRSTLLGYSKSRILGNLLINAIYTIALGKIVKDLGSGLNIFSGEVTSSPDINHFPDGMYFNTSLLMLILEKYSYKFFPIVWRETDQTSNARNTEVAVNIIKNLISTKLFRTPHGQRQFETIDKYEFKVT